MLTPPRFIVIDDDTKHLDSIVNTFQLLGSTCYKIHYTVENEDVFNPEIFKGVRGLFVDLHLTPNTTSTDHNTHYSEIVRILENTIQVTNGPFILILWTQYAARCQDLKNYIEDSIASEKGYAKPIHVTSLDKGEFLDSSGNVSSDKQEILKNRVNECFKSIPQLAVLFDWESRVISALNQTLIELINLVPTKKRNFRDYPPEIDTVLSRITTVTVGEQNVKNDPMHALNMSLSPVLLDKILNNHFKCDNSEMLNQAITKVGNKDFKIEETNAIGQYNKMLHLAINDSASIQATDWGAVLKIKEWTDTFSGEIYGFTIKKIEEDAFKLSNLTPGRILDPILIRVGAACDYAQQNVGLIPYCLGYKVTGLTKSKLSELKKLNYLWISPVLFYADEKSEILHHEPFYFIVNLRFISTYTPKRVEGYEVLYRLREQLLSQLIMKAATYASRPGIVELH